MREYVERFHNLSLMCSAGMPLHMLLQTCRHNFLNRVNVRMGAVKAHTWKELVKQAKIAEKSAKIFEPSASKNKWGVNDKGCNSTQSSQAKGKETMAVELLGKLYQNRIGAMPTTIKCSSFCQNITPLKMSRW